MQKRVLEVLKTWYFSYSAFWSAGQWGGYSPSPLATLQVLLQHALSEKLNFLPKVLYNLYSVTSSLSKKKIHYQKYHMKINQ